MLFFSTCEERKEAEISAVGPVHAVDPPSGGIRAPLARGMPEGP